jgi:TIR domain
MNSLLFYRVDIFSVLAYQEKSLKEDVDRLDSRTIASTSEDELVLQVASKFKIEIPVLEEDKAYVSHREIDMDVSQDPMRMIFDRSSPFYIKGTEITFTVPFRGDPDLFYVRPQTFSTNPPRGQIVGHEIQLVYRTTNENAAAIKAEFQNSIHTIKQHLGWLENSISTFNSTIGQKAQSLILQRRQKLAATENMISSLGIPVKQVEKLEPDSPTVRPKSTAKSLGSPKKWDVFISHASEDKNDLVRPLAQALVKRGVLVWLDEFSLKLGDSLRASIDFGLANSRFGVVVISKDFFAKHWPVEELNGLKSKEVKGRKVILPIWHKVTFEQVQAASPMLADKLAISSDLGIDKIADEIVKVLEEG